MLDTAKEWFEARDAREQRILLIGGILLVVMLFWGLLWAPLGKQLAATEDELAQQREQLAWMESAAVELQANRRAGNSTGTAGAGQSLLSITDRNLRNMGLGKTIQRIQPDGDNRVRLWLEDAPFDQTLAFLDSMTNRFGIDVAAIGVDRQEAGNVVNLRATLERAGGAN